MRSHPAACLIILALGLSSANGAEPPSGREAAVALVEKLGGQVETDSTRPGNPVIKVDLHGTKVTDADLAVIASLTDLEQLDLRLTTIGDEGVVHLKGLKRLRFLNLFRTRTGDAGLKTIGGLPDLETLLIGGTRITNEGLAHVSRLARLKKLSVFDTQIGDAGLDHLTKLSHLETLLIGKSKISDDGVKRIQAALPKIRFSEPT